MTETERGEWTPQLLYVHFAALRDADQRALAIKEQADRDALGLAREIQTYKDEKANELREQIGSERGLYVTRPEIKPLADYVTSQSGPRALTTTSILAVIAAAGILFGIWATANRSPASPQIVTVTIPTP